jgi:RNA polymerase sigma factor (sigma-70 family)
MERKRFEQTLEQDDALAEELVTRLEGEPETAAAGHEDGDRLAKLVRRAQRGDDTAREELINRLLPLVSRFARRYRTEGLDHTDLLQEGVVGLLRALERYDPGRGVTFPVFASLWVRQALQEARSDFIRPFRLPPKALRQLAQLKSEHQRIYQSEQRSASIAELAERTEIPAGQARALAAADSRVRSLDDPVESGGGQVGSLGDLLEDPLSAAAYEEVIDSVAGEQLRALLSRLTERERDVVRSRFGFDGRSERLVDIGQRLGVSTERVRQIEENALAKLRHVP